MINCDCLVADEDGGELDDDIDHRSLLSSPSAHWKFAVLTVFIAGVVGYARSYLVTRKYTSTASSLQPSKQQAGFAAVASASLGAPSVLASGPTRGAHRYSIFMVRANGSVTSVQQMSSLRHASNEFSQASALPGDTIFLRELLNKISIVHKTKDAMQILCQFCLSLAGIKKLGR